MTRGSCASACEWIDWLTDLSWIQDQFCWARNFDTWRRVICLLLEATVFRRSQTTEDLRENDALSACLWTQNMHDSLRLDTHRHWQVNHASQAVFSSSECVWRLKSKHFRRSNRNRRRRRTATECSTVARRNPGTWTETRERQEIVSIGLFIQKYNRHLRISMTPYARQEIMKTRAQERSMSITLKTGDTMTSY